MSEKLITVKEVALNNNCPECYNSNGLHLKFKQKFIENRFYKSITSDISYEIECKTCNTIIYPVRWKKDIEGVVEYHKKVFEPKKTVIKLKKLSWILVLSTIIVIIAGLVYFVVPIYS